MDIAGMFASLMTLVAGVTLVSELVQKWWALDGVASQVRSLIVGVGLGEVGKVLSYGFFADPTVLGTMNPYLGAGVIGLGAGLIANWSFVTPFVQWALSMLKLRPPQDQSAQTGKQP